MLLAGCLLMCLLQLAATQQQETFSVIIQPPVAKEGHEVTLTIRGGPHRFTQCQWSRETQSQSQSSNIIVTYSPARTPQLINGSVHSGRETVHPDCSLQLKNLRRQDTATYSVRITTGSVQQHGDSSQQQGQIYEASVFLPVFVAGLHQMNLAITIEPKFPTRNQHVTLTPKGAPREFFYCQWLRQTRFGTDELIQTYITGETQQSSGQKREAIREGCSLTISNLTSSDTGNYTVQLEALSNQQQQADKGNEESQLYVGRAYLQVTEQSQTNPHQSGSSSLSYSGGIIAFALLGSFSWLDSLLNSLFFSSLTSRFIP